jgi:peptide methionine sulfoxide reductase msrA/msrB
MSVYLLSFLVFFTFPLLSQEVGIDGQPVVKLKTEETEKAEEGAKEEKKLETATFAGGLFWYLDEVFDNCPGVEEALAGYTGGKEVEPYFQDVEENKTSHRFAVQVKYDPAVVKYDQLLELYWRNINPMNFIGQFIDRAERYKTAIYYHNEKQKQIAEASKQKLEDSKRFPHPVATEVVPFKVFYKARRRHQNVYKKFPEHFQRYGTYTGRYTFLEKYWPKPKEGEETKGKKKKN